VGIGDDFGHMVPFPYGHGKSIGCPGGGESSGFLGGSERGLMKQKSKRHHMLGGGPKR